MTLARQIMTLGLCLLGTPILCGCPTQGDALDAQLRALLQEHDVGVLSKPAIDATKVVLGQALYFDKILSGNHEISCATCHTPLAATADGLSLSIGAGGSGFAQLREPPEDVQGHPVLIPRNAPDVFSRAGFSTMFWDGRIVENADGSFASPAGDNLPEGLDSALAVQAMFPVTSRDEMRGQVGENEVADLDNEDSVGIWRVLMDRLFEVDEYIQLFMDAYPAVNIADMSFVHAANAIAAFEIDFATLTDSPFDQYISGDDAALSAAAKRGAILFYGEAGCARCHTGTLLTDEAFHNRCVPQLGPGKGDGEDSLSDFGRERETQDISDRYKFRTPPLRNVALTGPWMHDGAYTTLAAAARHNLDPVSAAANYDPSQLPDVFEDVYRSEQMTVIVAVVDPQDVQVVSLSDEAFDDLMAFLDSLTSPSIGQLAIASTPQDVPSGLPLAD